MNSHDLDGLLAAVRAEAWEQARTRLVSELADHWVEQGRRLLGLAAGGAQLAEPAGRPGAAESGRVPHAAEDDRDALWVYGVTPVGGAPPAEPGVGGARAGLVPGPRLSVLVSALADPLDLDDADAVADAARAHDAVLRAAFTEGSVLPMRFGTVLRRADVDRLAGDSGLLAALSTVEGLAEWKVTLECSASGPAGEPPPGESGSAYLARKATALRGGDVRASVAVLDAALRRVAVARNGEYVLVRRDAEAALRSAAAEAEQRSGVPCKVALAGPWPAFHFADLAARA